jgi:hypothetical protein
MARQCISMDSNGFQLNSLHSNGFQWISIDSNGFQWISINIQRISIDITNPDGF